MRRKFRILICDNKRFWENAWNSWVDLSRFEIQEIIPEAFAIFDKICEYRPHIVVVSENMKYISGIGMMKAVSAIPNYHPEFIITDSDPTTEKKLFAEEHGAAFYLCRPYSNSTLNERLMEIVTSSHYYLNCPTKSREQLVAETLHAFNIPANLKGYRYLRYAILLALAGSQELDSITKGLYPAIAEKFNTTSVSVERAIRHAVSISWEACRNNPADEFNEIFGNTAKKPSNSRFILTIAEKLHLELELENGQTDETA
jgi:two-component system response regulator (stage 0 sporulation protein A)